MFKTAVFKVHNPSKHKRKQLTYGLKQYHNLHKTLLESTLALPDLMDYALQKAGTKNGDTILKKDRFNDLQLQKKIRTLKTTHPLAGHLTDSLIADVSAEIGSYVSKTSKGDNECRPPTALSLMAPSEEDIQKATEHFVNTQHEPSKEELDEIEDLHKQGCPQKADRLYERYCNLATLKAAGEMLRSTETPTPRPMKFIRTRDFIIGKHEGNYYLLVRMFKAGHHYERPIKLPNDFTNVFPSSGATLASKSNLSGYKWNGFILPLEMGRYHDDYIKNGKPQSVDIATYNDEFYIHIAFEFNVAEIEPQSIIGIDRGSVKIGVAALIDLNGTLIKNIELDGSFFHARIKKYKQEISLEQKKSRYGRKQHGKSRAFVDAKIHQYTNCIVALALKHRAQVQIEDLTCKSMVKFVKKSSLSQYRKIEDLLTYKTARHGIRLKKVPAAYTSQTCAECGCKDSKNRPREDAAGKKIQNVFSCINCGHNNNADYNAAHIVALWGLHQHMTAADKYTKFSVFQKWLQEKKPGKVKNHLAM